MTTANNLLRAPQRPSVRPTRVAVMTTCMGDLAMPGTVRATVEVLRAMGFEPELPAQTCCGQPAINSGFPAEAARVLDGFLASFDGYDAVIVPSGSCAAMVVHHASRLLGPQSLERAGHDRLWEFTQFVEAFGQELQLHLDARITLHEGCHMLRFLEERESPRALLSRIAGVELAEMVEPDTCCGFGGTFAVKFPELSVAMADVKLDHAAAALDEQLPCPDDDRPHYLVSADPGCLLHLQGRADRLGGAIRTRHIAELVRDALPDGARR